MSPYSFLVLVSAIFSDATVFSAYLAVNVSTVHFAVAIPCVPPVVAASPAPLIVAVSPAHLAVAISPGSLTVAISHASLAVAVHPPPPLGAALTCSTRNARSTQPVWRLARSISFLVSDAPQPLYAASAPLPGAATPLCCIKHWLGALTAYHQNFISISKHLRLQSIKPKTVYLLSDAYSHMLNQDECDDSLLRFLQVITSWPRHGNVNVRASDLSNQYVSSPNSIFLDSYLKEKLDLEIHLVSWIIIAFLRAAHACFNVNFRQLRSFDSLWFEIHLVSWISIAVLRAAHACFNVNFRQLRSFDSLWFEIHLVSSVRFVKVIAELVAERDSPAMCLAFYMDLTLEFPTLEVLSNNSTLFGAINGNLQSKEIIGFVKDFRVISSGFASVSLSNFYLSGKGFSNLLLFVMDSYDS